MKEQMNENMVTEQGGEEKVVETFAYEYAQNGVPNPGEKKERVFLGFLGAFLGSLIGVVCIVLIGQWGYVASLSGVIMGFCALMGYQLLGRTISTKGIVICAVIMIIMVFISNQISYGFAVAEVYETDVITGITAVPMLLAEGGIETDVFLKDLGMLYLFTALGAVPTLKDHFKK